jgi:hypothetical protein
MVTDEETTVPWFIRKAMLAQGKYDPDALPDVDLEAATPNEDRYFPTPPMHRHEQPPLPDVEPAPKHWQERE